MKVRHARFTPCFVSTQSLLFSDVLFSVRIWPVNLAFFYQCHSRLIFTFWNQYSIGHLTGLNVYAIDLNASIKMGKCGSWFSIIVLSMFYRSVFLCIISIPTAEADKIPFLFFGDQIWNQVWKPDSLHAIRTHLNKTFSCFEDHRRARPPSNLSMISSARRKTIDEHGGGES